MEDEIDIRAQVLTVLRGWKLIGLLAVLAAVAAGVYAWNQGGTNEMPAGASGALADDVAPLTMTNQVYGGQPGLDELRSAVNIPVQ